MRTPTHNATQEYSVPALRATPSIYCVLSPLCPKTQNPSHFAQTENKTKTREVRTGQDQTGTYARRNMDAHTRLPHPTQTSYRTDLQTLPFLRLHHSTSHEPRKAHRAHVIDI